MGSILHNKKSLTFLGVAILILIVLSTLLIRSFSFLLTASLGAISGLAETSPPVEHFNLPKAQ